MKRQGTDHFDIHLHLISDIEEVKLKDTQYYLSDDDKSGSDLLYQYDVLDNDPIRLELDNTFSDYYGL